MSRSSDSFRILHVDDDQQLLARSEELLAGHDDRLRVETTDDPTAALEAVSESTYDAVISGSQLSGMDGLTLLTAVRDSQPKVPFVLFTAEDRPTIGDEPLHPEVDRYLQQSDDLPRDFKLLAQTVVDAITARRRIDRLESIENKYAALCANAPLAVIGWRPDGEICEWNAHAETLFGWSSATACGQQLEPLLQFEIDREQLLAGDLSSLSSAESDVEQLSHSIDAIVSATADGGRRICEWHSTPVLTADSLIVVSMVLDVTDTHERKATLQEYVAAVEASDDSIYMLDTDGNYVFANAEHCIRLAADGKIETATEEAVVGQPYESVHGPGDELLGRLSRIIAGGEAETEEYAFQTEDRWSYRTYSPVFAPETDEPLGVVVISKDITDRKRAENRASFLHSLLRHDVTNKLHAAEGYLNLAFETADQSTTPHLETATRLLEECLGLLDEVSMLSSVTDTEIEPYDLQEVISGVVESYRPQATSAGIDLSYDGCAGRVRGGPLLDALFGNLIGNAITHSNAESINIRCQSDGGWYRISVVDDGDGIETADADILEPGVSLGETGGSGLGLYLVSEITESYGGELSISDSPSGGLSITVRLQAVE